MAAHFFLGGRYVEYRRYGWSTSPNINGSLPVRTWSAFATRVKSMHGTELSIADNGKGAAVMPQGTETVG
jgi:hypothetical protein